MDSREWTKLFKDFLDSFKEHFYLLSLWFLDRSSLASLRVVLVNSTKVLSAVVVWSGLGGFSCICLFWTLFLDGRLGCGELSMASIEKERTLFCVLLQSSCCLSWDPTVPLVIHGSLFEVSFSIFSSKSVVVMNACRCGKMVGWGRATWVHSVFSLLMGNLGDLALRSALCIGQTNSKLRRVN